MNEKQALKVAAEYITEQAKLLAPEANRYKMLNARDDACVRAYEKYRKLVDALGIIERLARQGNMF